MISSIGEYFDKIDLSQLFRFLSSLTNLQIKISSNTLTVKLISALNLINLMILF